MPVGIFIVIWALWMGMIFGPHPNENGFLDKDNKSQCEVRK
jgi:hypothetical protein